MGRTIIKIHNGAIHKTETLRDEPPVDSSSAVSDRLMSDFFTRFMKDSHREKEEDFHRIVAGEEPRFIEW